jgi:hypothetical protein
MNIKIGIDPGVNTGIAVMIDGTYSVIMSTDIIHAMELIKSIHQDHTNVDIYIENPNLWRDHNHKHKEQNSSKIQGAGSIKRDYSVWTTFFTRYNMSFTPLSPLAIGSQFDKVAYFKAATSWKGTTNQHGRDAAKMIYRYYKAPSKTLQS